MPDIRRITPDPTALETVEHVAAERADDLHDIADRVERFRDRFAGLAELAEAAAELEGTRRGPFGPGVVRHIRRLDGDLGELVRFVRERTP